jgi:hypothetical protein
LIWFDFLTLFRRVNTFTGTTTTVAGNGKNGYADGPALESSFETPVGVCFDNESMITIYDNYNNMRVW